MRLSVSLEQLDRTHSEGHTKWSPVKKRNIGAGKESIKISCGDTNPVKAE